MPAGSIGIRTNRSSTSISVPTRYYMRNPNLLRTRGSYERLADEANVANIVWLIRKNPGTNRAYQLGIDREDGTLAHFTSVCAPMIHRGDRLPADVYGNAFAAEPAANLVSRAIIDDTGSGLRVRKAHERGEFLASTDERFRPVWISNAPTGPSTSSTYRGVIQQRADITGALRDHIIKNKLEKPTAYGRIYRVTRNDKTRYDDRGRREADDHATRRSPVPPERLVARDRTATVDRTRGPNGNSTRSRSSWPRRRNRARGFMRCGRSTASMRCNRMPLSRRSMMHRATCACRRSAFPSAGSPNRPVQCRPPSSST